MFLLRRGLQNLQQNATRTALNEVWTKNFSHLEQRVSSSVVMTPLLTDKNTNGCRQFSSTPAPSPIYELRVYRINMTDFKFVVDLFSEKVHLRTNHSKLLGYWTAEIGASIHEVVHIWEYDSLSHRLKVRQALAADKDWNSDFIAKFIPKVQYMKTALMAPVKGTVVKEGVEKEPSAVYTLQKLIQNSPAPGAPSADETLIGRFCGVLGDTNTEYRLWRYGNIDAATEAAYNKALDNAGSLSNVLLYPTKFSPLH